MADTGQEASSRLPIEQFARLLMQSARDNPQLIRRHGLVLAREKPVADAAPPAADGFAPMSLLADPTFDVRQYLEDLASIAVNASRQAEDAQRQARQSSRKTRYAMAAVVTFGILGVGVGSAGYITSRSANGQLSEVNGNLRAVETLQRETGDQLAAIRSGLDERPVAAVAAPPPMPAAVAAPVPMPPARVSQPSPAPARPAPVINTEPWPDSRPYEARPYEARPYARRVDVVQHHQTVVVPPFFTAIQRNFRALFR